MNTESLKFLNKLLETPSPSGYEGRIQTLVKSRMKPYADEIYSDLHGNLIVGINTKAKRRVMLAGHCDQIGFMIKYICAQGYLYVHPIGGIDKGVLPGAEIVIHSERGPVTGFFGRKPIHLQSNEERGTMSLDLSKLWIDIGAKDRKDAERHVKLGDTATFALGGKPLLNNLIAGAGLDDRTGLFVVMETLRTLAKTKLNVALYAVSTVQEEIGLRGARTSAYALDPEVGIAVDVAVAADNPGQTDTKATPSKVGAGPLIHKGALSNPVVTKRLLDAAKAGKIKYQLNPDPQALGNDSNAMQISRGGMASGSVQIPNRYMHTQAEVCSLDDLDGAIKILARFVKDIKLSTDFRPF